MKKTILVVDDDLGIRESLSMALESEGFEVIVTDDGFVAYSIFREQSPDVILTDIVMPILNGLELVEQIKRVFPETRTKIIVISAGDNPDLLAAAAMNAGADAFTTKPIDADVLVKTVNRLLAENGG